MMKRRMKTNTGRRRSREKRSSTRKKTCGVFEKEKKKLKRKKELLDQREEFMICEGMQEESSLVLPIQRGRKAVEEERCEDCSSAWNKREERTQKG